jgi:hypothetical protein
MKLAFVGLAMVLMLLQLFMFGVATAAADAAARACVRACVRVSLDVIAPTGAPITASTQTKYPNNSATLDIISSFNQYTTCPNIRLQVQTTGAVLWSSDIPSTFESLQVQVRAGLSTMMSGIPWWTTDVGGFTNGDIRSPYFQELVVRWYQCVIFVLFFVFFPGFNI